MYLNVRCLNLHILLHLIAALVLSNFFFGVLIMMDKSCLLSVYHFHIVHSVHHELNSIKTINQIKKSSCLCNLDMCSLCFKIRVSLYFRCFFAFFRHKNLQFIHSLYNSVVYVTWTYNSIWH